MALRTAHPTSEEQAKPLQQCMGDTGRHTHTLLVHKQELVVRHTKLDSKSTEVSPHMHTHGRRCKKD